MNGSITVVLDYEDEYIRVTVKDTGVGIKDNDKEKLFKLFGKLEDTA